MKRLKEWNPTAWDNKSNYLGDRARFHWFVAPVILTRDADLLEQSNFETVKKELEGEKGVEIHSFGHWACGYYDIILIHPWRKDIVARCEEIEEQLYSYPVLDEDHLMELEAEEEIRCWELYGRENFIDELQEHIDLVLEDYSTNQIDSLWYFLASRLPWDCERGDSPHWNLDGAINLIGTTLTDVYFEDKKIPKLTLTERILDRIMRPEEYRDHPNQLKLF